jgi:hypothetical protein
MRGPFLLNQSSPSTTMKKHILTLTALIALAGCSSATAPKALQSAPMAKAKATLPNAHDAAAHDRLMVKTIKDNILAKFPGLWEAKNGPTLIDEWIPNASNFGPGFCDPDKTADQAGGCASALSGKDIAFSEIESGRTHKNRRKGIAFGLAFHGLSIGQCIDLLDVGVASIGAQAVSSDGLSGADPQTPAQVSSWCRGASKDGLIDELTLFYTPNVAYEFLNAAVHPANPERRHSGS